MDVEGAFSVVGSCGKFQKFLVAVFFLTNISSGMQIVMMVIVGATPNLDVDTEKNLTTIVTEWNLYNEQWIVDLMSSLFMAGYAVGVLLFGQISDLVGRKWTFTINYILLLLTGVWSSFCTNWKMFAAARTIVGFFVGASGHIMFALMVENIGSEYWAITGMSMQGFFSIGVMLLALFGRFLQNWRHICLTCSTIPMILVPILIFIVPESSRWLYHVGKIEKAEKVLQYIANKNGKHVVVRLSCEDENNSSVKAENLRKYSFIDLFRICKLALYALCSFYIWFACSFVYYGLTFDAATLSPNIYIATLLSGVIEIPSIFISFIMMRHRWFGRKGTLILLFVLSGSASMSLVFADGLQSGNLLIIQTALGLVNKLAVSGVFSVLYIYMAEIFPTQLRLVAIGGSSMFARVGAIISPFVPLLAPVASYLPYAIFGLVAVLGAVLNLHLPETLHRTVPSMRDFEKKDGKCEDSDSANNVLVNASESCVFTSQEVDSLLVR
uniref:solute carrier family 22 member 15-like isoform X1 n=2 Tax=Styela clava TaxID=7725 RepID=UPI001939DD7C|nr:solute carrier family 22 member 15-like isoform X1 [Styela clava]